MRYQLRGGYTACWSIMEVVTLQIEAEAAMGEYRPRYRSLDLPEGWPFCRIYFLRQPYALFEYKEEKIRTYLGFLQQKRNTFSAIWSIWWGGPSTGSGQARRLQDLILSSEMSGECRAFSKQSAIGRLPSPQDGSRPTKYPKIKFNCDTPDVIFLANYYLKSGEVPPDPIHRANANGDDVINLSDVIYIANYYLKGDPAPHDCGNYQQ